MIIPPSAHAYNNVIYGDFEDYIRLDTHTHTHTFFGCGARLIESSDALICEPQHTGKIEGVLTAATISAHELHESGGESVRM